MMKFTLKAVAVVIIIAGCLASLTAVKGASDSGRKIHKMIYEENNSDWARCRFEGTSLDEKRESVVFAGRSKESRLTTPILQPGFEFDDLILSWNAEKLPEKSALDFEVSVSPDSLKWYDFQYLVYGLYDSSEFKSFVTLPTEIANIGQMATDELKLKTPMNFARVTVRSAISEDTSRIYLRRISVCFASHRASQSEYAEFGGKPSKINIGKIKLSVPYYTQRNLPENLSGNCCSPTSVSMILNYFEKDVDRVGFCRQVYDPYHDMYGNWPFNMQAAYIAGMSKTWVEIHSSFDELYKDVLGGKPVVISIAFGYDELPNSLFHESLDGHLIAVEGFDGPDIVICNDPMGHGPDDGIVHYPRKELEKVWQNHGGVVYHLWP